MTMRTRSAPRPIAALAIAWLPVLAGGAGAQSIDELQDELARTRDELRTAQELITTLRGEVARLHAELRELRGEEAIEPQVDLPADPLACPDCMASELARRYERDLAHVVESLPAERFAQLATDWCEEMRQSIRGRREWLISVADLEVLDGSRDHTARIRVYDEVSLLPLGGYELVQVPARFVAKVQAEPDAALWLLAAEIAADPMYDPDRPSRGAFDAPTFVGPYVESGFSLDWITLTATDLAPTTEPAPAEAPPLPSPPPPGPDR